MIVRTIKDWEEVPAGTLLYEVRETHGHYVGYWAPDIYSNRRQLDEVPVKLCRVVDTQS